MMVRQCISEAKMKLTWLEIGIVKECSFLDLEEVK